MQTKVVEGQENPLAIIATARLYEVQKSCSLTGHVWDGYWVLGNKRAFEKLPADVQQIIKREIDKSATDQRADVAKLNTSLMTDLKAKGITFIDVQQEDFRKKLAEHGLLRRVEVEVRRGAVGAAGEGLRQARLTRRRLAPEAPGAVAHSCICDGEPRLLRRPAATVRPKESHEHYE